MPPEPSHAPKHICLNFPLCQRAEARPKVQGKRTAGNGFCTDCIARAICLHPGCQRPIPADQYKAGDRKRERPIRTHGFCTEHIADPCNDQSRVIWARCSSRGVGCRYLALKRGGGHCFACNQGFLPCRNALRGCPRHVRGNYKVAKLSTCTTHETVLCPFDPNRASTICSQPWCGQELQMAGPGTCVTCAQGLRPCVGKCGQRAIRARNGRCEYCPDDGTAGIFAPALPTLFCATVGRQHVVTEPGMCWHCSTGSLPCEVEGCGRRVADAVEARCEECISGSLRRLRLPKKVASQPCKYASRSCNGTVPAGGADAVCGVCRRNGPPCTGAPWGCRHRCRKALSSRCCPLCARKGLPCRGKDKRGCLHRIKSARVDLPRRAAPHNKDLCVMCRPKHCCADACLARVSPHYWRDRFCRKHGRDAGCKIRRPYQTNGQMLTKRFRKVIGQESQRYQRCSIEWCAQAARVHVRKTTGQLPACKLHASWLTDQRTGTSRGLRKGRFAARCALADAVFGDMPSADLSPTGDFEYQCETCCAWYFSAESVPCPSGGKQRVFSRCCQHGRLADVPLLPPAPPQLAELLTVRVAEQRTLAWHPFSQVGSLGELAPSASRKRRHRTFADNIRRYNSAMAFASFCDHMASPSKKLRSEDGASVPASRYGPPVYIMHGRVYHKVGTLYPPSEGAQPQYSQLYIYDPAEATTQRSRTFQDLEQGVLSSLHDMLVEQVPDVDMWTGVAVAPFRSVPRNPYPAYFKNMHEQILLQAAAPNTLDRPLHALRFAGGTDHDPRTYNAPTSAEVSCMVVGEGPLPKKYVSVYERLHKYLSSTSYTFSPVSPWPSFKDSNLGRQISKRFFLSCNQHQIKNESPKTRT